MKDDCDHELAVVPDVVALYSDDSATKQTELGSNSSGSGVASSRTSGGGEASALRSNASHDDVRQVVRAAAELFVPELAAAHAVKVAQAAEAAHRARTRARRDSAAQALPTGVRGLIRATAEIFASADSDESGAGDANWDSDFEAALLSNIDAEAFASDADAGAADEPEESLAAAVLNHIDLVSAPAGASFESAPSGDSLRSAFAGSSSATAGASFEAADTVVDDDGDGDDTMDALYEGDPGAPELSQKVKPRVRTKRTRMRSKTIAMKRLTRAELQRGAVANPPVEGVERPVTRSECAEGMRPCPWVACKHHLYLDINPRTGSIKINFPDLEPWELQHTCALDVADNGGLTLEEIGLITNLTRERVRQVEVRGLLTLRTRSNALR